MASEASVHHEDASSLHTHLFNTSFSTYRVSPLYVGGKRALDDARLHVLAQRLRATLVGDVVRGVEVGLDGGGEDLNLGALERVELRWVEAAALLGETTPREALIVSLRYENAV